MKTKSYGLQNETRQYLRRLYAYGRELAGPDIADLDDFVKGLKQLGLWGNTVCWPMRSQHNIGTGSALLSLGGAGEYTGTLVNSPSWSSTGIVTSSISPMHYISLNTKLSDKFMFTAPSYYMCVYNKASVTAGDRLALGTYSGQGGSTARWLFAQLGNSAGLSIRTDSNFSDSTGGTNTSNRCIGITVDRTKANCLFYQGSSQLGTAASIGADWNNSAFPKMILLSHNSLATTTFTTSFIFATKKRILLTDHTNLFLLYKSTIGKGFDN